MEFTYHALRKQESDERSWLADFLPKAIGRALGLYWTWDDLQRASTPKPTCIHCGGDSPQYLNPESPNTTVICASCRKPWESQAVATESSAPTDMLVPLTTAMVSAYHGKKPGDIISIVRKVLRAPTAPNGKQGGLQASETLPGALMMDAAWGSPKRFRDIIAKAEADLKSMEDDGLAAIQAAAGMTAPGTGGNSGGGVSGGDNG